MERISLLVSAALFLNAFATIATTAEARAKRRQARPRPAPAQLRTEGLAAGGYWTMADDVKSVTYRTATLKAVK